MSDLSLPGTSGIRIEPSRRREFARLPQTVSRCRDRSSQSRRTSRQAATEIRRARATIPASAARATSPMIINAGLAKPAVVIASAN